MISLQNDSLKFDFPEIRDRLAEMVEKHVKTVLPHLLSENRQQAVAALHQIYGFSHVSADEQRSAERKVIDATPAQIEKALRERSMAQAGLGIRSSAGTVGIEFQRTLRIPDDGNVYPLPAGLGAFPLRHLDDFEKNVPAGWAKRGGVLMPMYQSEALWIYFDAEYPFAVKIAAGKINAITGEPWADGLQADRQNYVVVPEQPWLDGFAVGEGVIRQFVAMRLGAGYSAEEQLTGKSDVGGIQVQVFPMSAAAYFRSELADSLPTRLEHLLGELIGSWAADTDGWGSTVCESAAMGLGAGGMMRQEIYRDPYDFEAWDTTLTSRCFVHLCNSLVWREITGSNPPHPPFTAQEYTKAGVPWFDHYRDDLTPLAGSEILAGVKSVATVSKATGEQPFPGNATIQPQLIIQHGNTRRPDDVRQWVEQ